MHGLTDRRDWAVVDEDERVDAHRVSEILRHQHAAGDAETSSELLDNFDFDGKACLMYT